MAYDYENYSIKQLVQAEKYIDLEKYPNDYKELREQLEQRKDDIVAYKKNFENRSIRIVKFLGYFQLVATLSLAYTIALQHLSNFNTTSLLIGIALVGLNAFSGWYLIHDKLLGYGLSLLNQVMQSIAIQVGGFSYQYLGIGGIYLYLTKNMNVMGAGFSARLKPGLSFLNSDFNLPTIISVNILAVFFVFVLIIGLQSRKHYLEDVVSA